MHNTTLIKTANTLRELADRTATPATDLARGTGRTLFDTLVGAGAGSGVGGALGMYLGSKATRNAAPLARFILPLLAGHGGFARGGMLGGALGAGAGIYSGIRGAHRRHIDRMQDQATLVDRVKMLLGL